MTQNDQKASKRRLYLAALFFVAAILLMILPYPVGNIALLAFLTFSLLYLSLSYLQRGAAAVASDVLRWLKRKRQEIVGVLVVLAVIFIILGTHHLNPQVKADEVNRGVVILLVGWVALIGAVAVMRPSRTLPYLPHPTPYRAAARLTRWHWVVAFAGGGLLALLAEINGGLLHIPALRFVDTDMQFVILCASITLLGIGLGGVRVVRRPVINARLTLPVVGIVLLALGLRFWNLRDANRVLIDEGAYVGATETIQNGHNTPLLMPMGSIAAFPYLYPYIVSHGIAVFGHNFLGLRTASAILGTAGVAALYWLAKSLFDRPTALIAALLLATFPPHLQFSRIGINEMGGPLFATLGLAFLSRGLIEGRHRDYVLGGLLMGITHYFDEGSRLLFLPLVVFWLAGMGWWWRPRLAFRRILLVVLLLVVVAAPIYYTLVGMDRPLFARMVANQSGLAGAYWSDLFSQRGSLIQKHITDHVIPAFLIYIHQFDSSLFYAGTTALILPVVFVFFAAGLGYALSRIRQSGPLLVVLWILAASLGNSLLVSSASVPRFVLVFPAIALAVAVGIRYVLPMLFSWRPATLMILLTLALALIQTWYYFGPYLPVYNTQIRVARDDPDGYDAALRSVGFLPNTLIYIISPVPANQLEINELMTFLRSDLKVSTLASSSFTPVFLAKSIPCGRDIAFFILPDDQPTIDTINRYFYVRSVETTPYNDLPPGEALTLYYAPSVPGVESLRGRSCPP